MKEEIVFISNISAFIGPLAVIAGLVFTYKQLQTAYIQLKAVKSIEEAKLWLEIRKSVKDCDKMHLLIAAEVFDKVKARELIEAYEEDIRFDYEIELYNYLGNFEILKYMLYNGVIDRGMFKSQHFYRLQILAQHQEIMELIHNDRDEYWVVIRNLLSDFDLLPKKK